MRWSKAGTREQTGITIATNSAPRDDLAIMFTEVGLESPVPIREMRADHQIAQKLHARSTGGSDRARDLVDLQLLESRENLNLEQIRDTCVRFFEYRRQQQWPPVIAVAEQRRPLYAEAADGVDTLRSVDEAIVCVNGFIRQIASAGPAATAEGDR
ncbi:nucleotidyl transferase AbiEii/AbiGii toxin family protein [Leucobacter sp. NPDC015123]|uniref:nucleotidyl transferase AbiEii/AbiGii toxin family protein n=1 Tax=Leucobacter sp. NPDC015123 TaxID=3364129 RepID=UPI0036F472DB